MSSARQPRQPRQPRTLFADEHGFTTTSMVLALLLALSLVFATAQVYRVNSASAEVQDVADAVALAAENQVGEFMLVVRLCDAVVLSLTLTGLTATGLGLACLCTPATATLSDGLLQAARHVFHVRDQFSTRAKQVLQKLQEALPFFAAACAAAVAQANNAGQAGAAYLGVAVLVPAKGEAIEVPVESGSDELLDSIEDQADDIRQNAREAEDASDAANRSKERAFLRDCGDNPAYCMYERAGHLAGLSGSANPLYASVDAWSFAVALARARAYYHQRALAEAPADWTLEEQARSSLRARFYRFAETELAGGYVHETADSFDAYLPHLPRNTAEMRFTVLYTEAVYPITEDEETGEQTMHAWAGCPRAAASLARGSIQQLEQGDFQTCPVCGFTPASMGNVAAASTSISNGFEYHYKAVADEASVYEEQRRRADQPKGQVKGQVGAFLDTLRDLAQQAAGFRIDAKPPGRYGAVALVVNAGALPAVGPFASAFVAASGSLGPRAAIAGSTLLDEGTEEGSTVVSSVLDGLGEDAGAAAGAAGFVLDCWSWMLLAYANGQDAVLGGVESALNALPLFGASGLGTWAAGKLRGVVEDLGLQPAELGALKPVLVNSGYVAAKGDGSLAQGLTSVKAQVYAHPLYSTDLFAGLLGDAEATAIEALEGVGGSIEVARLDIADTGVEVPLAIPLPAPVRNTAAATVQALFARLRSFYFQTTGVRVWE